MRKYVKRVRRQALESERVGKWGCTQLFMGLVRHGNGRKRDVWVPVCHPAYIWRQPIGGIFGTPAASWLSLVHVGLGWGHQLSMTPTVDNIT